MPTPPFDPLPPAAGTSVRRGAGGAMVAVGLAALGVWAVLLVLVGQFVPWGQEQFAPTADHGVSRVIGTAAPAAAVAMPALLVWRLTRHRLAAVIARTWALAAILVGVVSPLRLVSTSHSTFVAAVLAAVAALAAFGLSRTGTFGAPRRRGDGGTLVVVAAGVVALLPWVYYGALGGVEDLVVAGLLAAALGWLVAVLVGPLLREAADAWSLARFGWIVGLCCGIALLLLVSGLTPPVSSMFAVICVPPMGFVVAACSYAAPRRTPMVCGTGVAVLGPVAFVDPDEVSTLLGGFNGIVLYAFLAAGIGLVAGLIGSGVLAAVARFLRSRVLAAVVAALALVATCALYAGAGQPGLTGERLFVVLADQASLADLSTAGDLDVRRAAVYERLVRHADRTQKSLRADLDQLGVSYQPYYLVNAIEVDAGTELKPWLQSRDDVRAVLDSPRLRPIRELPPRTTGRQPAPAEPPWNLTMIRVEDVWSKLGVRGEGIVVGQSDTGVDGGDPALAGSYRGRDGGDDYNWLDPWFHSTSPHDWGGHGTHTLGTAVGSHHVGVAPGAKWIGCVNLARNMANPALYLDCLQFMLAPYPQGGDPLHDGDPTKAADVLNNSWGCPPSEGCNARVLRPAVRALTRAGIFVVASAGNDGPGCQTVTDPLARYSDAFTVGAVNSRGSVASFSSRGPVPGSGRSKPDIAAPGVGVLSSLPGGRYGTLSGTSMAAPHVTGTVALMWSASPKLAGDVERTAKILRETAQDAEFSKPPRCGGTKDAVGAGIVDAYAAVRAAMRVG